MTPWTNEHARAVHDALNAELDRDPHNLRVEQALDDFAGIVDRWPAGPDRDARLQAWVDKNVDLGARRPLPQGTGPTRKERRAR